MANLKTVDIKNKKYVVATPIYLDTATAEGDDGNIDIDSAVQYLVEAPQSPDVSADEYDRTWDDEHTRALIQAYGINKYKFSVGGITPSSIWVDIMEQAGIKGKSIATVKKKWRNLIRTYRKVASKPNLYKGRVIWKFYHDMAEVLDDMNEDFNGDGADGSEGIVLGKRPRFAEKDKRKKQLDRINQYLEEDLRLRKEDLAVKKQFLSLISQLVAKKRDRD